MPNWCNNNIKISGTKENIAKFLTDVKENESDFLVSGIFPEIQDNEFRNTIGTKWDIEKCEVYVSGIETIDLISLEDIMPNYIELSYVTAWSPSLGFSKLISEKYNFTIEHTYGEGGCDFAGRTDFENGEVISEVEYTFLEGMYKEENDIFWENEGYLDDCEYENYEQFYERYKFMSKEDLDKLFDNLREDRNNYNLTEMLKLTYEHNVELFLEDVEEEISGYTIEDVEKEFNYVTETVLEQVKLLIK
jgi:hypothetical protein